MKTSSIGAWASLILEWRVPAKEVEEGNMARARGRHGEAMLLIFHRLNAGDEEIALGCGSVHSRSRLSTGTYPVQQTHLGHWPSISRIESMREAHECVVVPKHQLVGSQRNERLVLGRRQD